MSKILGIDLGTTNCCMAIMEGAEPTIVPNAEGGRTTPSMVAIKDGERLVGVAAKRQSVTNPDGTIFSSKRFIGHLFDESKKDVERMPFKCVKGKSGEVEIVLEGKNRRPAEISAMILQKLKADAEKYTGEPITKAVITVPAYFNDAQRQATKDAGKIAGLEVERIINEPTAAALAYGMDKKGGEKKIAVYDLGGGTFDISILEIDDVDGEKQFEVLSTNGNTQLGGDDFDQKIIEWLVEEFKKEQGVDLSKDKVALQRLKDGAEKAKIELSSQHETEVNIPFITSDGSGAKHLNIKLNRAKLEDLIAELIEATAEPCRKAMEDAKTYASDIDEVILVGGMTRMPSVQEKVKDIFGKEPHQGINPDEVVALGAALQGGVLQGDVKDILLLDVTPLTLSIETLGSVATPMIERNTTIPTTKSQVYSTAADNQTSVEIHVMQGERPMAADNKSLGRFVLDGIPPSPRGVPQIEVAFDIDANGIVNVKATDKATNKEQDITISGSSNISDEEIEKMKKEAEQHAEEDKKKQGAIQTRNNAESLIMQSEKTIKEAGDKITDDVKKPIEEKIAELKKILENKEAGEDEIKPAYDALSEEIQKVGAQMYQNAAPAEGEAPKDGEAPKEEDPDVKVKENVNEEELVEGEVVEEDKKE